MANEDNTLPEGAAGEDTPVANQALLDLIDAWFNDQFHNSVTSRDVQVFNHCLAAKEELKRRVAGL